MRPKLFTNDVVSIVLLKIHAEICAFHLVPIISRMTWRVFSRGWNQRLSLEWVNYVLNSFTFAIEPFIVRVIKSILKWTSYFTLIIFRCTALLGMAMEVDFTRF